MLSTARAHEVNYHYLSLMAPLYVVEADSMHLAHLEINPAYDMEIKDLKPYYEWDSHDNHDLMSGELLMLMCYKNVEKEFTAINKICRDETQLNHIWTTPKCTYRNNMFICAINIVRDLIHCQCSARRLIGSTIGKHVNRNDKVALSIPERFQISSYYRIVKVPIVLLVSSFEQKKSINSAYRWFHKGLDFFKLLIILFL